MKTLEQYVKSTQNKSKVAKASEWRQWRRSGVYLVNFEQIAYMLIYMVFSFESFNDESKAYLGPCQESIMDLFWKNS